MTDFDPKGWLADKPSDPDDHPRYVWLERMITSEKRRAWLWQLAKKAPIGAGAVILIWQAALFIAERFPAQ